MLARYYKKSKEHKKHKKCQCAQARCKNLSEEEVKKKGENMVANVIKTFLMKYKKIRNFCFMGDNKNIFDFFY